MDKENASYFSKSRFQEAGHHLVLQVDPLLSWRALVDEAGPECMYASMRVFDLSSSFAIETHSSAVDSASWHALPNEMKLAVIDFLDEDDVKMLSTVDQRTYRVCIPARFRVYICVIVVMHSSSLMSVSRKSSNYEVLELFLENVYTSYWTYIEDLCLFTKTRIPFSCPVLPSIQAASVVSLLSATPILKRLVLEVEGSLDKSVLLPFNSLTNLRSLSIANCGDEINMPL